LQYEGKKEVFLKRGKHILPWLFGCSSRSHVACVQSLSCRRALFCIFLSSDAVQIGLRILNSSLLVFGWWFLAIGCSIWIRFIYPVPWGGLLLMKVG